MKIDSGINQDIVNKTLKYTDDQKLVWRFIIWKLFFSYAFISDKIQCWQNYIVTRVLLKQV